MTLLRSSPAPGARRRVLGIDPSVANMGIAVLERAQILDLCVLTTPPEADESVRVAALYDALRRCITHFAPTEVALEEFQTFYRGRKGTDPGAMFLMKAGQTTAHLAALHAGLPVYRYAPSLWKPKGDAKDATRRLMQARYGIGTNNKDACDALAIATFHLDQGHALDRGARVSAWGDPPPVRQLRGRLPIERQAMAIAAGADLFAPAVLDSTGGHGPSVAPLSEAARREAVVATLAAPRPDRPRLRRPRPAKR